MLYAAGSPSNAACASSISFSRVRSSDEKNASVIRAAFSAFCLSVLSGLFLSVRPKEGASSKADTSPEAAVAHKPGAALKAVCICFCSSFLRTGSPYFCSVKWRGKRTGFKSFMIRTIIFLSGKIILCSEQTGRQIALAAVG